jgi:hypothetical protein
MNTFFKTGIRCVFFILICVALSGCAVEIGPSVPAQSIEAAVQTVLAKQGYYQGPIDGAIGPAASRAIRNYQRDHRLTPTGTINSALLSSMGLAPSATIAPAAYYAGYPAYYSAYAAPAFSLPAPVINLGWGGGWPAWGNWNRGWGGGCYPGWGGGYNRGWGGGWNRGCGNGNWNRGWGGGYRGYGGNSGGWHR